VIPFSTGSAWEGGDLILWPLKMRIEIQEGEGFLFLGSLIAHQAGEVTKGVRNSLDLFVHKSNFDCLGRWMDREMGGERGKGKEKETEVRGRERVERNRKQRKEERREIRQRKMGEKKRG
jgi:hypothetical protein